MKIGNTMSNDAKHLIENAINSALPGGVIVSYHLVNEGHSQIFAFSADVKVAIDDKPIALRFYRLKSTSGAALYDAGKIISTDNDSVQIPVLLTPSLSIQKQKSFREDGIFYIDDAGNAWLVGSGMRIDIQGRKSQVKNEFDSKYSNVFADKATLVLRILFEYGPMGVRDMSRLSDELGFFLSPGYISKVASSLEAKGYAVRRADDAIVLRRKRELLEDWIHSYRKLRNFESRHYYIAEVDMVDLVQRIALAVGHSAAMSDRAGASLIDAYAGFDSLLLLAKDMIKASEALRDIGAREVDRGANVELVIPRYKVSAFFGMREISGCYVVSDLQLYLDLMCQPIRGLEAAEHLFTKQLARYFSEEDEYPI